jgi:hypothetical protein
LPAGAQRRLNVPLYHCKQQQQGSNKTSSEASCPMAVQPHLGACVTVHADAQLSSHQQ